MHSKESVVQMALNKQAQPGWAVFPLSKFQVVKEVLFFAALSLLFGAGSFFIIIGFFNGELSLDLGIGFMIALSLILTIWGVYAFTVELKTLINVNKSVIVLTDKSIVKAFNNEIEEYPYEVISDLVLVIRSRGGYQNNIIQFVDKRTNTRERVKLAERKYFGREHDIFEILKEKVNSGNITMARAGTNNVNY